LTRPGRGITRGGDSGQIEGMAAFDAETSLPGDHKVQLISFATDSSLVETTLQEAIETLA